MHKARPLIALLAALGACGAPAVAPDELGVGTPPPSVAAVSEHPSAEPVVRVREPLNWPNPDANPPAISCVYRYPDDLRDRATAFDATIVDVGLGTFSEDAAARPATLTLSLNEVFKGSQKSPVVMNTWDFSLPPRPQRVVGVRILAAAGKTLDLMACGFTRPYSESEADQWRDVFTHAASRHG